MSDTMDRRLTWTLGFLSFPLAGIAGGAAAGAVAGPGAALVGGLVTGLVVGTGQSLAGRLDPRRWIPATTLGMGAGLALGAAAVGYGTSLPQLAVMGALTGTLLGVAQSIALPVGTRRRWAWAAALPALWASGWTVTTLAGVDVEAQYTIFGSLGAIAFSLLSGLLLHRLLPAEPRRAAATRRPSGRSAPVTFPR
jgi:hypothetical protein